MVNDAEFILIIVQVTTIETKSLESAGYTVAYADLVLILLREDPIIT